ncbi:TPA: hypothetical protein ACH3X1_007822 [Trebouxia sp. C0004]
MAFGSHAMYLVTFASAYIAVRRLLRCQSAAQKTVVSEEWSEWGAKRDYREKARFVSKAVLDTAFWTALANFCIVLKPLVRLLRLVDSNMPSMSKVRRDFRDAVRKLVPASDYIAVLSQHTKFTNKEGIFGDADIMTLT